MANLKTNYKDDVLNASVNGKRKYNMIQNADGTVSFDDVTTYTQNGDSFGAKDINDTNTAVNDLNSNLLEFKSSTVTHEIAGNYSMSQYLFSITGKYCVCAYSTANDIYTTIQVYQDNCYLNMQNVSSNPKTVTVKLEWIEYKNQ